MIGIVKEGLGFRQFSLRGEQAAAGEWCLVCLAYNLKRLHVLLGGVLPSVALAQAAQRALLAAIRLLQAACRPLAQVRRRWFAPLFPHQHRAADRRRAPRADKPTLSSFSPFSPTGC